MKPPDPTAAGTLNCTGVVPELFKFATGAIIKVAPRYQSHPILRYFTDKQFQMDFRLTREAFETLLRIVAPRLQNNASTGRPTICVKKQLLAVIWLLASQILTGLNGK
jgi:hypothetical protein